MLQMHVFNIDCTNTHLSAARDAFAQILCAIYEPRIVCSLCILIVSAHAKQSGQKVVIAIHGVALVGEWKI